MDGTGTPYITEDVDGSLIQTSSVVVTDGQSDEECRDGGGGVYKCTESLILSLCLTNFDLLSNREIYFLL